MPDPTKEYLPSAKKYRVKLRGREGFDSVVLEQDAIDAVIAAAPAATAERELPPVRSAEYDTLLNTPVSTLSDLTRAQEQIAQIHERLGATNSENALEKATQLLQTKMRLFQESCELEDALKKAEQQIAALSDSARIHSNILTGQIALTKAQAIHIAGLPADIEQQIAALQGRIEEAVKSLDAALTGYPQEHRLLVRKAIRILTAPIAPEKEG